MSKFGSLCVWLACASVLLLAGCGVGKAPYVSPIETAVHELNLKGVESVERGDAELAQRHFLEALRLSDSIEYRDGSVASLLNLSRLDRRAGRLEEASVRSERAATLAGSGTRAAEVAFERALVALGQGRPDAALIQARAAVDLEGEGNVQRGASLNLLARVQQALQDDAAATVTARQALSANRAAENPGEEANSERLLAELALKGGDLTAAEQGFARALALDQRAGLSLRIAADLRGLARCAAGRGNREDERHYLQRALAVSLNGRDFAGAARDLELLAALYRAAGDQERAAELERQRAALPGPNGKR